MNTATFLVIAFGTAIAMEFVSGWIHRYIGHGVGWPLHRGHHETPVSGFELNDLIPAVSAAIAIAMMVIGVYVPGYRALAAIATGATIYGCVYFVIHDVYIHRRIPLLPHRVAFLEPYKRAHLDHHRTGTDHWRIFST